MQSDLQRNVVDLCALDGGGRPRIPDQSRRLPKFGGRVVLRGQRLRISRSDRGYREGLAHRRQGIRPVRRGHAKSGRKDLDLPPARSYTPLCIRTATWLVARRRCGNIRQISADFTSRPSWAETSGATRGAGGSLREGTAQSHLRNLAGTLPAGVAPCSGGAALQQT
jgi:hypothetical protein